MHSAQQSDHSQPNAGTGDDEFTKKRPAQKTCRQRCISQMKESHVRTKYHDPQTGDVIQLTDVFSFCNHDDLSEGEVIETTREMWDQISQITGSSQLEYQWPDTFNVVDHQVPGLKSVVPRQSSVCLNCDEAKLLQLSVYRDKEQQKMIQEYYRNNHNCTNENLGSIATKEVEEEFSGAETEISLGASADGTLDFTNAASIQDVMDSQADHSYIWKKKRCIEAEHSPTQSVVYSSSHCDKVFKAMDGRPGQPILLSVIDESRHSSTSNQLTIAGKEKTVRGDNDYPTELAATSLIPNKRPCPSTSQSQLVYTGKKQGTDNGSTSPPSSDTQGSPSPGASQDQFVNESANANYTGNNRYSYFLDDYLNSV